jgi:hypothetical protein
VKTTTAIGTSATTTTTTSTSTATTTATTPSSTAAPSASQSAEVRVMGHLGLFGDPGTRVSVDGVAKGNCPIDVAVEPGDHEVRFTFDATNESVVTSAKVKSSERIKLRADFTGATPSVRVQR